MTKKTATGVSELGVAKIGSIRGFAKAFLSRGCLLNHAFLNRGTERDGPPKSIPNPRLPALGLWRKEGGPLFREVRS